MIFSVMPKTTFHFSFFLKFTDHMTFNVEAHLLGEISNVNDVSNIDFTLAAIFHQDILDYIAKEINKQFKTAVDAEENELNSDKAKVAKAKAAMEEGIDKAKKALDAVKPAWDKLSSSVHGRFDSVISGYKAKLRELEGAVEGAKEDYKKALSEAESAVKKANSDRAEKMEDAQRAVRDAKEEWGRKIDEAQGAVSAAEEKMKSELKNAEYVHLSPLIASNSCSSLFPLTETNSRTRNVK
jgi:biopolymer transport protein ExbB/TolQ